ncbi:NRDE family protein [Pseudomonas sp.]|uniref:NRDE family protein n=1 Tax=Pseudomonas sp. TaxID=306 RepID=UPI00272B61E2|nr:NRDE family protein [Pseudomonas sp.]
MCLLAFAWQQAGHTLLLLGNRDEFHARPTRPAAFWNAEGHHDLLAGKDLEAGGTWMGITRSGRFAALTNIRNPALQAGPRSRGELVRNYLTGDLPPGDFVASLAAQCDDYAGFNLLAGDLHQLWHLNSSERDPRPVTPGVHALSNASLDSPWPKTRCLRSALAGSLEACDDTLFELLADPRRYPDDQLPTTGISLDWERMLSAAFIIGQDYGTRASSILRIGLDGSASLVERRFGPMGRFEGDSRWALQVG